MHQKNPPPLILLATGLIVCVHVYSVVRWLLCDYYLSTLRQLVMVVNNSGLLKIYIRTSLLCQRSNM